MKSTPPSYKRLNLYQLAATIYEFAFSSHRANFRMGH